MCVFLGCSGQHTFDVLLMVYGWVGYSVLETSVHVCARSFRDCYSDEHYFATLLATHGRDNETDCLGGITYAHWEKWGDSHPKAWAPEEVTANLYGPTPPDLSLPGCVVQCKVVHGALRTCSG